MTNNVAVAISGGRDSMLALSLLREQGWNVVALHAFFMKPNDRLRSVATKLEESCRSLSVPLHVVDLSVEFERLVVQPFMDDYVHGRTPNPCALCNRHMKFGLLMDAAQKAGADRIATGHYARLEEHPEVGTVLRSGLDRTKDQSYFLALVPQHALAKALFPLADWHKADVMDELDSRRLPPPLPSESQEVCFVPNDDYKAFLQMRNAPLGGPGPVVLLDGTPVGRHQGLWRYTLGQRKGLAIAWKHPLYVVRKDMARNTLVMGTDEEMRRTSCRVGQLNMLVPPEHWPEALLAKTRYRQRPCPAKVELHENWMELHFARPEFPPTSGQVAALYTEDGMILAGGVIEETPTAPK